MHRPRHSTMAELLDDNTQTRLLEKQHESQWHSDEIQWYPCLCSIDLRPRPFSILGNIGGIRCVLFLPSLCLDCRRPSHEPKRFAFRKLHRKMRDTARSFKWALGLRCTTSAYRIFKSFGGRFRTALPTSLIFDCCARLKTASGVPRLK